MEGSRGLRWFHAADDNCVSSLVKVTPCTRSETGRWRGQIFLHSDHLFLSPPLFKVLTPPAALMGRTFLTSRAKKKKGGHGVTTPSASTALRVDTKMGTNVPLGCEDVGAALQDVTSWHTGRRCRKRQADRDAQWGRVQRLSCSDAQIPNKKFPPAKPSYLEGHF